MGKVMEFFHALFDSWLNRDEAQTQPTETTVPETTAETTAATEGSDTQQVKTGPDGEDVIPVDSMPSGDDSETAEAATTAPAEETVEETIEARVEETEEAAQTSPAETEADAEETAASEPVGGAVTPVAVTEGTEATETTATEETGEAPVVNAMVQEPATEEATFIGGFLDGGWMYAMLGLAIALLIGLANRIYHNYQKEQRRKRKASRRQQAEQTQRRMAAQTQMTAVEEVPADTVEGAAAVSVASGMRSAVFQDVGAREDQQDSYGMTDPNLYHSQGVLALVADGMGGLANGKAVSSELVNTFLGGFGSVSSYEKPQEILLDLAIRANYSINEHFRGADRSGSTLVSVMVREGYLHFLTVGDSRIYLYRAGTLLQLNREHIYQEELAVKAVNRQVPIGQVTADRQAHALTSFFGIGTIPYMDRNDAGIKLMNGDRILLCSDGVFGTLTQEQMEYALQHDVKEAAAMMRDLIREADRPYQDNNTGLILEFLG